MTEHTCQPWLALAVCGALGAACSQAPASEGPGDASSDSGDTDAQSCLFCSGDAGAFTSDASLGRRAYDRMSQCNSVDGCHISGAPPTQLYFVPDDEALKVVNVPAEERPSLFRVHPGDPAGSYLYLKVVGDGGIEGGRMPLNAAFDPTIPALFLEWIEAGAPAPDGALPPILPEPDAGS